MILQRLREYDVLALLNSDTAVAVCKAEGSTLTGLVIDSFNAGFGTIVLETAVGYFALIAAIPAHVGPFVDFVRRAALTVGFQHWIKRPAERWPTPGPNSFSLPDGRVIEVGGVFAKAQNFTQWGLARQETLPASYIRV